MEASVKVPRTVTDLSLDHLKIMLNDRISPRRRACVENKYDLLKYVWKESQIDDCYLEKYKVNNIDEISRHDDAFSRHLLESTNRIYTGQNEYARQRLADRIQPVPQAATLHGEKSLERFEEKKFRIHDLVRTEIGNKWWEFGRHLKIAQGKLDTINSEQNEVARKVDEVFRAFELESYNEFSYVDKISNALISSRRTDLSKKLYRIMES